MDVAVEVISPESDDRDRVEKFEEYANAGVLEYWIIDPELRSAEFYVLNDGAYRLNPVDAEGRYWSAILPGFWIKIDWLWNQPRIMEVLQAWQIPTPSDQ